MQIKGKVIKFTIFWQNCFFESGTKNIEAATKSEAIEQFGKDFGPDYLIIAIKAK